MPHERQCLGSYRPPGVAKISDRIGRPIVKRERRLAAVEIDLEHAVDRLAGRGEFVERGAEQALLEVAADIGQKNDKPGMQRLGRVELPEIAGVVGDEDQVVVARVARDIPVLPAGAADMRDMPGFMAALPGGGDQLGAEAFVDQKLYGTAMVSSRRRARRTGWLSRHGCWRVRPRRG